MGGITVATVVDRILLAGAVCAVVFASAGTSRRGGWRHEVLEFHRGRASARGVARGAVPSGPLSRNRPKNAPRRHITPSMGKAAQLPAADGGRPAHGLGRPSGAGMGGRPIGRRKLDAAGSKRAWRIVHRWPRPQHTLQAARRIPCARKSANPCLPSIDSGVRPRRASGALGLPIVKNQQTFLYNVVCPRRQKTSYTFDFLRRSGAGQSGAPRAFRSKEQGLPARVDPGARLATNIVVATITAALAPRIRSRRPRAIGRASAEQRRPAKRPRAYELGRRIARRYAGARRQDAANAAANAAGVCARKLLATRHAQAVLCWGRTPDRAAGRPAGPSTRLHLPDHRSWFSVGVRAAASAAGTSSRPKANVRATGG